jgi:hypothetical protein
MIGSPYLQDCFYRTNISRPSEENIARPLAQASKAIDVRRAHRTSTKTTASVDPHFPTKQPTRKEPISRDPENGRVACPIGAKWRLSPRLARHRQALASHARSGEERDHQVQNPSIPTLGFPMRTLRLQSLALQATLLICHNQESTFISFGMFAQESDASTY